MPDDYKRYRDAVRKKVCEHCIDYDHENAHCTLTGDKHCGVELYLENIVKVVQSVKAKELAEYVKLLRETVCHDCKNQEPDGSCQLRSESECGLDRYFELIVEAIEEVDKSKS
ncbi:MAG: hypothetical protein COV74_02420 [Candidatus Omnitrophica bacterium CG11_big_fil_rev_8_21_14_0_20_45_26]|uniref:Uncharacterized protein n=1 Tax=Candidatus Abzuiibacterium crystallinum TaxID=1974748 RepID=A0A2H0LRF5_9BACT|nr:MAG: hypothetical protein COV74_02420 [Candidatus Omnitrophica bacterium CG11_big_fil_rev_8_21_14_0_20_45_26]